MDEAILMHFDIDKGSKAQSHGDDFRANQAGK